MWYKELGRIFGHNEIAVYNNFSRKSHEIVELQKFKIIIINYDELGSQHQARLD